MFNEWMVREWSAANTTLDRGEGVKPVRGAEEELRAILAQRRNPDVYRAARTLEFRDDRSAQLGVALDDVSVHTHLPRIAESGVAIHAVGSWFDAGTSRAVLGLYENVDLPITAVIGAWPHGGGDLLQRWLPFFDAHLKDTSPTPRSITYHTFNDEKWKSAWPVATKMLRLDFAAEGKLASQPIASSRSDRYVVDATATTGETNRWRTELGGGDVQYGDRTTEDQKLLTYTSDPLAEDVEVTGVPRVTMQLSTHGEDAAVYAYLEDVDETGHVTYITEGQLRPSQRKLTFRRADALPITRQPMTLRLDLFPTSYRVPKGHRIRVAIAGHDASVFRRYAAKSFDVHSPSFVELPVAGTRRATAQYNVRFDAEDKRLAHVRARIVTNEEMLLMYPDGANHLPKGWATFVRNLRVTDENGRLMTLQEAESGQWRAGNARGRAIDLRYEILLHHDAGRWPFGWDEAAYVKGDAVFITGKALFIAALDLEDITVSFELPEKWQLISPWRRGDTARDFLVPNAIELTEVGMLLGRFEERTIRAANLDVVIGTGQALRAAVPLFEKTIRTVLPLAIEIFGGSPEGTFVVVAEREEAFTGGGSFTRSVSMLFEDIPTESNRADWGHIVTHELLHLWNGGAIRPKEAQEYWFSEGFTDYFANVIELRAAVIDETIFRLRIDEHIAKYKKSAGTISLRAGGEQKADHYDLVYSGGLLAALALDNEIRARSAHSLADLMNRMYAEFGNGGRAYTMQDVERIAGELAGRDLSSFFAHYVEGTAVIPDSMLKNWWSGTLH